MSLPKYIANMDEVNINIEADTDINVKFPEDINKFIKNYFDEILAFIKGLESENSKYRIQKVYGLQQYIPALSLDFETKHKFDKDVLLTGITYSQTGWKTFDTWDMYVDSKIIFEDLFTKELGEYKHMNIFYPIKQGEEIKFIHHNSSGNSKQIWWDIHYLVKEV